MLCSNIFCKIIKTKNNNLLKKSNTHSFLGYTEQKERGILFIKCCTSEMEFREGDSLEGEYEDYTWGMYNPHILPLRKILKN